MAYCGGRRSRNLFRSFHLEVLAYTVLQNITISDFPSGVRFIFDKARDKIKVKLPDPAGYSDDVAAHVSTQEEMEKLIKRLQWAYDTAKSAEALASSGNVRGAFEKWASIFDGYFPAYG
jgi:hypothetical protein